MVTFFSQRNMDRWEGKVAVVTGAGSGIGAAISTELVKAGLLVAGLDKRLDNLEKLSASLKGAKGKLYARECDVAKEEDLLEAFKWVNSEFGGIDILVNNAGLSNNAKLIDDDIDSFRKVLNVNVLAVAIGVREAVASMKKRGGAGYIININSILGHFVPGTTIACSLYSPSKWAVTALTETVRKELAAEGNDKIKITSISPGLVRTGLMAAGGYSAEVYDQFVCLDPKDIADAVLYVLGTPDKVQVTELTIRPVGEVLF